MIQHRSGHAISLTDVDEVAKLTKSEPGEVLALLASLSRRTSGFLEMQYFTDEVDAVPISRHEVAGQLRRWWKKREIDDDTWRAWAEKVVVTWSPTKSDEVLQ
jgi:hypothetical protein